MVKRQTVNLIIRMDGWFESICSHKKKGIVTQQVECQTENLVVVGSIPINTTNADVMKRLDMLDLKSSVQE